MSLHIGILVLTAGRDGGGPETYERELLRAIARVDRTNRYTVYCTDPNSVSSIDIAQANISFEVLRPRLRMVSLALSLPRAMRRDRVEVLHATFAPPPTSPARLVFTSHGLVNFKFPECFPRSQRLRLNALHRIAMRDATQIICVSDHAYHQMMDEMRLDQTRLHLIHHGVGPQFVPLAKVQAQREVEGAWKIEGPYVLFVGKVQRIKNVCRLLEAFAQFRSQHCPSMKLVLVGRPVETIACLHLENLKRNVIQLGYVSSERLAALYQGAEMMILPSLFESFGLPVLEAMGCGTPVIATRVGALPEICGDAARMVDPLNVTDMATAMGELFLSETLREDLRQRGYTRVKAFSWDEAARKTVHVYEQAMTGPRP